MNFDKNVRAVAAHPGHVEQAFANIATKIEDRLGVTVWQLWQANYIKDVCAQMAGELDLPE
jgi:hypothetical protein